MSLRIRLFLILSTLMAILVVAQWWWVRGLARDLAGEIDDVAVWVGNSVASALVERVDDGDCTGNCDDLLVTSETVRTSDEGVEREARAFFFPEGRSERVMELHPSLIDDDGTVVLSPFRSRVEQLRHKLGEPSPVAPDHQTVSASRDRATVLHRDVVIGQTEPDTPRPSTRERGQKPPSLAFGGQLVMQMRVPDASADRVWRALEHRIPIPHRGMQARLEDFRQRLWLGSAGFLALGLVLSAVVAHRVTQPLRQLSTAAHEVGAGALGTQVQVDKPDREVAAAVTAFNQMSTELAALDRRSKQLAAHQQLSEIGEIAQGLAHTLRNPLNALGLSVEELAGAEDTRREGLVQAARRQIRRIDHSIRSFLALASEGGGIVSQVDVAALAQDVVLEALQDAGGRVRIALDTAVEGQGATLAAVAPELRAVLQALVVNAVEASPDGSTVEIAMQRGDTTLEIEVADRGPGLPEAIRARLFTPHQSTKTHGSGMGLFLAQRIATNRYGGTLRLDDREGGGTRARLTLGPREEAHDA